MIKRNTIFTAVFGILLLISAPSYAEEPAKEAKYMEASASSMLSPVDLVIKEQLEAIRERNDRVAYELNAEEIKDDFEDPQSFMRMIRRKKSSLYEHVSYEILSQARDDSKFHKVRLLDKYGQNAMAMFKMKQDADGAWKTEDIIVLTTENDPL